MQTLHEVIDTDNSYIEKFDPQLSSWAKNVQDHLKPLSQNEICEKLKEQSLPFSVMMSHINGDFNIGSVIRSANGFGAKEVFYYGKRKLDRRGALGCYHYTKVKYIESIDYISQLKSEYRLVGLENNINRTCFEIKNYNWNFDKPNLIILGEESKGLSNDILDLCDDLIYIDMSRGSIRSFNAAVASSIAMYDFVSKFHSS